MALYLNLSLLSLFLIPDPRPLIALLLSSLPSFPAPWPSCLHGDTTLLTSDVFVLHLCRDEDSTSCLFLYISVHFSQAFQWRIYFLFCLDQLSLNGLKVIAFNLPDLEEDPLLKVETLWLSLRSPDTQWHLEGMRCEQ